MSVATYRRGGRRRMILVLLVLSAVTLITLDERGGGGGMLGDVRSAARDVAAPVQDAVAGVFEPVGHWFDGVFNAGDLEAENERLRRELEEARGKATEAEAALSQNRELRELNGMTFLGDIPTVPAEVVLASPGNFQSTVEIDRGTDDGITVGMPVAAGDGLVGRITDASGRRATVQLITDPSSGVGARLVDSRSPGVVEGRSQSDLLQLVNVDPDTTVLEGELVVTSGVEGSIFPPEIPIGRVVRVDEPRGALEKEILVRPLVDMDELQFLRVLQWPLPGQ